MKINNKVYYKIFGANNEDNKTKVFVGSVFGKDATHLCIACLPNIIHGSSDVVKTNDELLAEVTG